MKNKLLYISLIGLVLIGTVCLMNILPTGAQHVYLGMYWIAGQVDAPSGGVVEGSRVIFYQLPLSNNQIVGPYSDDLAGTVGLAGVANRYILNAFEDWRMVLSPGQYYVAIPNSNPSNPAEGWGANPVEVTVTGNGYDIAPNLTFLLGAGPMPPADRPLPGAEWMPIIKEVKFGNRIYQWQLAAQAVAKGEEYKFYVSPQPRVSVKVASVAGLDLSKISMVQDVGSPDAITLTVLKEIKKYTISGPSTAPTEVSFNFDYFNENKTLVGGTHQFKFSATNAFGSTEKIASVIVYGGEPAILDIPLFYPSPLHIMSATSVTIQYTLSHDMNLDIYIFDVGGRVVKKYVCFSRQEGGTAGTNKVTWDLITDQGGKVGSGIYVVTFISKDTGKLLGKGKFTALP